MSDTFPSHLPRTACTSTSSSTACDRYVFGIADAIGRAVSRLKTRLRHLPRRCAMALLVGLAAFGVDRAGAAVVYQFENGAFTGASGVMVHGKSYHVRFQDGSCIQVFNGCVLGSLGPFSSRFAADAASEALRSDVLLDVPEGQFDTFPQLICGYPCRIYTLYSYTAGDGFDPFVSASIFTNRADDQPDTIDIAPTVFADTELGGGNIWAVWTAEDDPEVTTVPEPGTLTLLGAAGLALAWTRRRRARSTPGKPLRLNPRTCPAAGA